MPRKTIPVREHTRRPGAGRKPLDPAGPQRKFTINLGPAQIEHCERLAGSVQEALRRLLAQSQGSGLGVPARAR